MEKVLIAMSGGVDSSVAAWLLRERGYDLTGAMMKLYESEAESGCCSAADAQDAREVAGRVGIPFYVFNFIDDFAAQVIDRFVAAYQSGATPNPCIDCNRYLKFERFLRRADELGIDLIATGHYARIVRVGSRWALKKGLDPTKDQSYALYTMTQAQLARTLFPLGELSKAEARELASAQGLVTANKRDSQDICFAPGGDYAEFIEGYTGVPAVPGAFKDTKGNILGQHKGIVHYTVGQRKGLGISAERPLYVCRLCPQTNAVVLGGQEELYAKTLTARDINIIAAGRLDGPLRVRAKIRYNQTEQAATVWQLSDSTLRVEFDQTQRAITKGQAVVLYDGETIIGGGVIDG